MVVEQNFSESYQQNADVIFITQPQLLQKNFEDG